MILAGVLLKLGGYGLLRVFPVLLRLRFRFGIIWVALSLVGGLFVSERERQILLPLCT
jgi:NADH-ubiquinone oxidoreductase chain 4